MKSRIAVRAALIMAYASWRRHPWRRMQRLSRAWRKSLWLRIQKLHRLSRKSWQGLTGRKR